MGADGEIRGGKVTMILDSPEVSSDAIRGASRTSAQEPKAG